MDWWSAWPVRISEREEEEEGLSAEARLRRLSDFVVNIILLMGRGVCRRGIRVNKNLHLNGASDVRRK